MIFMQLRKTFRLFSCMCPPWLWGSRSFLCWPSRSTSAHRRCHLHQWELSRFKYHRCCLFHAFFLKKMFGWTFDKTFKRYAAPLQNFLLVQLCNFFFLKKMYGWTFHKAFKRYSAALQNFLLVQIFEFPDLSERLFVTSQSCTEWNMCVCNSQQRFRNLRSFEIYLWIMFSNFMGSYPIRISSLVLQRFLLLCSSPLCLDW